LRKYTTTTITIKMLTPAKADASEKPGIGL
jgi:hypothetical protein